MKAFFFTLVIIAAHLPASAQQNKFSLTLNPFSLLERDGGFTPGIGYRLNKRIAIFSDFGLIFYSAGNYTGSAVETGRSVGYKIKPALRLYLTSNKRQEGGFLELEGLYKQVKYDAIDEVAVADNNGNFAYTYIGGYTVKKKVYGVSLKLGNRFLMDNKKRFGADIYIGLGSRYKDFSISGLPANARLSNDPFSEDRAFNFFWRRGSTISLPLGAKLFYNF